MTAASPDGPSELAKETTRAPLQRTRSGRIILHAPPKAPPETGGRGKRLAMGAVALLALGGILAAIVVVSASQPGPSGPRSILKDVGFVIGESRGVGLNR